jgi:AIPR protein
MPEDKLTIDDLGEQIRDFASKFKNLPKDDLFVVWFLRAYVTDSDDAAVKSLTGASNEGGVDAVLVDDDAEVVHLVQGKYHASLSKHNEGKPVVLAFADWADVLLGPLADFESTIHPLEAIVQTRLREARNRLEDRGYKLVLYFVTTGKTTGPTRDAAQATVRRAGVINNRTARFEFVDGMRILEVLRDYLYGVAPAVPLLELPSESEMVNHHDAESGIDSWIFTMRGDELGKLVRQAKLRLFALNIRGYLGNTAINRGMRDTLAKEPQYFRYFNNGVTFVCDGARREEQAGSSLLAVTNPQIINGQQTTRTLHGAGTMATNASVLVRVISIPRGTRHHYDHFISRIVEATNWQNAISIVDLRSNDATQLEIERSLRRHGYYYARKKETVSEIKARVGRHVPIIRKEELAKAVAGCKFDSLPLRGQRELFGDSYAKIFDDHSADFFLTCYWMYRISEYQTGRGQSVDRQRGKWVTLYTVYQDVDREVGKKRRQFVELCESEDWDKLRHLDSAIAAIASGATKFYRLNRGKDDYARDATNFFKSRGLAVPFARFLEDEEGLPYRTKYQAQREKFMTAL